MPRCAIDASSWLPSSGSPTGMVKSYRSICPPAGAHSRLGVIFPRRITMLVIVDTLAAFFDGQDFNDAKQAGDFMRRLRPATQIKGLPVVVVAAHPVKNAAEDNLVPYGSGAILNEVDGNLTLSKVDGGLVRLHWHGKLRGLEFAPLPFRIETACSPDVLDVKGREVALPVVLPSTEHSAEDREKAEHDVSRKLLRAMIDRPDAGQRAWAAEIGAKSHSTVNRRLHALKREK